jgi:repressor LexA
MRTLSPKQQKILTFIRRFLTDNSYPPTIRDIVRGCGVSSTSVADYNLGILEKEGYIRRHREVSRGIEVIGESLGKAVKIVVPVIGQIAAGQPIPVPTIESWNSVASAETMAIPQDLIQGKEGVYALKVKGLSMIDALINDGDIVLLQHTNSVENGDMAAVWLKGEKTATLKKVYASTDKVRLQPANSQMEPIYTSPENVEIQGRVIAVIRQLT